MPARLDLTNRHRARAASSLVDLPRLYRSLSAVDPQWRERKRLSVPLHREAVVLIRDDDGLRQEPRQQV